VKEEVSLSKVDLGKIKRPYLESKLKPKGLAAWLEC
jgi:hypothetical protein